MRAYVVFTKSRWTEREMYWTGGICARGGPEVSSDSGRARYFVTAREAYEAAEAAAETHGTQRLQWWRVGLRTIRRTEVAA